MEIKDLPKSRRETIFWIVFGAVVLMILFFWVKNTVFFLKNVEADSKKNIKQLNFPNLPEEKTILPKEMLEKNWDALNKIGGLLEKAENGKASQEEIKEIERLNELNK